MGEDDAEVMPGRHQAREFQRQDREQGEERDAEREVEEPALAGRLRGAEADVDDHGEAQHPDRDPTTAGEPILALHPEALEQVLEIPAMRRDLRERMLLGTADARVPGSPGATAGVGLASPASSPSSRLVLRIRDCVTPQASTVTARRPTGKIGLTPELMATERTGRNTDQALRTGNNTGQALLPEFRWTSDSPATMNTKTAIVNQGPKGREVTSTLSSFATRRS